VTEGETTGTQSARFGEVTLQGKPPVSVVMSVFNGERFLAEAVESILGQTFGDFEFIIVDDGSTDGSPRILHSYANGDSRVRIYHQPNQGLAHSLNRGCALARGRYIARMDADDVSVPDRLMWQVRLMEEYPELGAAGGWVEYIDNQGRVFGDLHCPLDNQSIRSDLYQLGCPLCHPATIMRKSVFLATGGYREPFLDAEDYDLWLRFAEHSQLANLDRVVLKYRHHAGQVSDRRLRQQCLSTLAAREIALSGRSQLQDVLKSVRAIGPAELAKLGVDVTTQQQYMAARYRARIRRLEREGVISAALNFATEMFRSSQWEHAERWIIADIHLRRASFYRRQGMIFPHLKAVVRALITRPVVAGRPLKRLLQRVGIELRRRLGSEQERRIDSEFGSALER